MYYNQDPNNPIVASKYTGTMTLKDIESNLQGGKSTKSPKIRTGPKGGKYYIKAGKKIYVS